MATKKGSKLSKAHRLALSKAAKLRYAKKRKIGFSTVTGEEMSDLIKTQLDINEKRVASLPKYTPAPNLTLCGQLEDAILLLENRISNSLAKINSLM